VLRLPSGGAVSGSAVAAALCAGAIAALGAAAGAPLGYVQPLLVGGARGTGAREPDIAALLQRFETAAPTPAAPAPFGSRARPPAIRGRRHG
jgi:hypothetical protein